MVRVGFGWAGLSPFYQVQNVPTFINGRSSWIGSIGTQRIKNVLQFKKYTILSLPIQFYTNFKYLYYICILFDV